MRKIGIAIEDANGISEALRKKIGSFQPEDVFVLTNRKGCADLPDGVKTYERPKYGNFDLTEELRIISEEAGIEIEMIGSCANSTLVTNALLLRGAIPDAVIRVVILGGAGKKEDPAALEALSASGIEVKTEP